MSPYCVRSRVQLRERLRVWLCGWAPELLPASTCHWLARATGPPQLDGRYRSMVSKGGSLLALTSRQH